MEKLKGVLFNILMVIAIWYGSQFIFGFIAGFILALIGADLENAIYAIAIGGIIISIISELIYFQMKK